MPLYHIVTTDNSHVAIVHVAHHWGDRQSAWAHWASHRSPHHRPIEISHHARPTLSHVVTLQLHYPGRPSLPKDDQKFRMQLELRSPQPTSKCDHCPRLSACSAYIQTLARHCSRFHSLMTSIRHLVWVAGGC